MAALIHVICSVSGLLAVLLVSVCWLLMRRESRGARMLLVATTVIYCLLATRAVPFAMSRWLVAGFHAYRAADVPSGRSVIILLAGGEGFTHDWDNQAYPFLSREDTARIAETVRVFRLTPGAMVISSGGANGNASFEAPSSVTMKNVLVQWGVPAASILLESESATTHDEAVLIAPMVQALHPDHLILVTSDIHMYRSMGTFRAAGMNCIPAIARDPFEAQPMPALYWPTRVGLELSDAVVHEYVGIIGYRLRGWFK